LAALILKSNEAGNSSIKLKGILIGHGIISFEHLERSEIEFMVSRSFVDPETLQYWRSSCQTDPDSAGCQFFLKRYREDVRELNPYSKYLDKIRRLWLLLLQRLDGLQQDQAIRNSIQYLAESQAAIR
jgi:hypothetical protein